MSIAWMIPIWAAASRKTCPYCKARNERKAEYCIECGHQLPPVKELSNNKWITVVGLLGITVLAVLFTIFLVSTILSL